MQPIMEVVPDTNPTKKILIIGKAPSSMSDAPCSDTSWDVWTLSDMVMLKQVPRCTLHFELHSYDFMVGRGESQPQYLEWLKQKHDFPIICSEHIKEFPSCVLFPKVEIVERFGTYFSNTVSWMIALAIQKGATDIGIYGVDMAAGDAEYTGQRPSCEYFMGWAKGLGINLIVAEHSDLLKTRGLYGFDSDLNEMHKKWASRQAEMQERYNKTRQQRDQSAVDAAYYKGALEAQGYYAQWMYR
ncbi:hypothetical protein LCGC14_2023340 [marine sediment metagenome]|uniref:Uncharacterized protein n=1 Tax=marine sediment metagenome TaxID=412755 RepID=A0A0F9FJA9_9ZZZZ